MLNKENIPMMGLCLSLVSLLSFLYFCPVGGWIGEEKEIWQIGFIASSISSLIFMILVSNQLKKEAEENNNRLREILKEKRNNK